MTLRTQLLFAVVALVGLTACGSSRSETLDASAVDATVIVRDASGPSRDAGQTMDAGSQVREDAGSPSVDAGSPPVADAGSVATLDAGSPPLPDSGTPLPDAGGVTCERASVCSGDLSAVGGGDFSVAFRITTTATASSAIISQRRICMHHTFWGIRMTGGRLGTEIEGGHYAAFTTMGAVNDGAPHEVRVCRKSGHAYVFIDGVRDPVDAPATGVLSGLVTLQTGSDPCVGFDGTIALVGTVDDVCVGAL